MPTEQTFGELLKKFRVEAGLGMREMARCSYIDSSYYSKIEKGQLGPPATRKKIERIIAPLELSEQDTKKLLVLALKYQIAVATKKLK